MRDRFGVGGTAMGRMKFLCDGDRCRRVVTINDGQPGERSVSMACMHCTDAPCQAVCPVNAFYTTADGVVLHSKDFCIGCGYCFYACPFGAPQYPRVGNFGSRGKMDKCTYCSGGQEPDGSTAEWRQSPGRRQIAAMRRDDRPSRCSPATARSSDRSTRTGWASAATVPAPGGGRPPITKPSRRRAPAAPDEARLTRRQDI